MMAHVLLILGVAILSLGFRSFQNRTCLRLGTLGIATTSFLIGWLLGGHLWQGALLTVSWLFLPWLEILTRIRHLRLPREHILHPRPPPNQQTFPGFSEISEEIETEGFEYLEDIGWHHENARQFFRVLQESPQKLQACICLAEQDDFSFHYTTLTSRAADGRVFMTWNYPLSYGLKPPPHLKVQRFAKLGPFTDMLEAHAHFLQNHGVTSSQLRTESPEEVIPTMQADMRKQITHNIDQGLLKPAGKGLIRYTLRGMFFLWLQFLRDFIRFS